MRTPKPLKSIRYSSPLSLLGRPLLSIASGPDSAGKESFGRASGIIAIGDVATGVVAVGGVARGVFANGGVSMGVVSSGGVAIGGFASGAIAIGAVAVGAVAIGLAGAFGGRAIRLSSPDRRGSL